MHLTEIRRWQHTHTFGADARHPGERRTHWVIAMTVSMMVVEIVVGLVFGSMALPAASEVSPKRSGRTDARRRTPSMLW